MPPKSSISIGFSIIHHPFWGTTIFGITHFLNTAKKKRHNDRYVQADGYRSIHDDLNDGNLGVFQSWELGVEKMKEDKILEVFFQKKVLYELYYIYIYIT